MTTDVGDRVIGLARDWVGTPYHHQASTKHVGCDCLGLLRGVYREHMNIDHDPEKIPPYSPDWAESGHGREDMLDAARRYLTEVQGEPQPGDLVVFRFRPNSVAKHCAIVSYNGKMIHAHQGNAVIEVAMVPWWQRKIAGVFRFQET